MPDMRKEVLRFLRDRHPASNVDIIPMLKDKFPDTEIMPAASVLGEMAAEAVVSEFGGISKLWLVHVPPRKFKDLEDSVNVSTSLHEAGIRELERYEAQLQIEALNNSVMDTNKSIKTMNDEVLPNNFRITRRLTNASIIVSATSALFVLASVIVSYFGMQMTKSTQSNTILQRQVQVLDSMLHVQMTALKDTSRRK